MDEMHIKIFFSLLGGILPAILWLLFWLKEDDKNPEPKRLIAASFVMGMIAVPIAFYVEKYISDFLIAGDSISNIFFTNYSIGLTLLILWSLTEEVLKYLAAYFSALKSKFNDEPIDSIIYLITTALGFAALENVLYIINAFEEGTSMAIITGNLRFIGSSLLHVAASGIVGIFCAFSFYKNNRVKKRYILIGLASAIALHTMFNSFIIRSGNFTLVGLSTIWIVIIFIILLFEKIKKIYKPKK